MKKNILVYFAFVYPSFVVIEYICVMHPILTPLVNFMSSHHALEQTGIPFIPNNIHHSFFNEAVPRWTHVLTFKGSAHEDPTKKEISSANAGLHDNDGGL